MFATLASQNFEKENLYFISKYHYFISKYHYFISKYHYLLFYQIIIYFIDTNNVLYRDNLSIFHEIININIFF